MFWLLAHKILIDFVVSIPNLLLHAYIQPTNKQNMLQQELSSKIIPVVRFVGNDQHQRPLDEYGATGSNVPYR